MKKRRVTSAEQASAADSFDEDRQSPRAAADRRIESSFMEGYVCKTYLADGRVNIHSFKGVVTLTGQVRERLHRTLAEQSVLALTGVVRVENQLATDEEVAAEDPDTWLGRKVMLALRLLNQANASQISVDVQEGVVTLQGDTISAEQKARITDYARNVEGVRDVVDLMTITSQEAPPQHPMPPMIDDASITAQVNTALRVHRSTRGTEIRALTRDGVVTLTGVARTDKLKTLAGVLVGDIRGVTSVNNEMSVDPACSRGG